MSSGSGPIWSSLSSVGASSGESCRFAGASTRAERDALSLDHERAFHAQLAAVDRAGAGAFPPAGGLGHAAAGVALLRLRHPRVKAGPCAGSASRYAEVPQTTPIRAAS